MKPEDLDYLQSRLLPHKLELMSDSVIIHCQSDAGQTRSLKLNRLRGTLPENVSRLRELLFKGVKD
jgi:hypothetical protein